MLFLSPGITKMQCFIYKSQKKEGLYIYLDKKDDFSKIPQPLINSVGHIEFVMELELTPKRQLAREDVNKVIQCLQNKGFFVQMPPTIVPEALLIKNSKLH